MKALIAKCIRGHSCQYDGNSGDRQADDALLGAFGIACVGDICPEQFGGLSTPREYMEIQQGDGRDVWTGKGLVKTASGLDCTESMKEGAKKALQMAQQEQVDIVIGRRRSPSCSSSEIYDGTFSRKRIEGPGVAIALLQKNGIQTIDIEDLVTDKFKEEIKHIYNTYYQREDWDTAVQKARDRLSKVLPLGNNSAWHQILRVAFAEIIPAFHKANALETDLNVFTDSDTVRFFSTVLQCVYDMALLQSSRRCRICTYPEGFLDVFIADDGICSACKYYQQNEQVLDDRSKLGDMLRQRLEETRNTYRYNAMVACSGGKDSTYMMLTLAKDYPVNMIAVMDDLNQQNDISMTNFKMATNHLDIPVIIIPPPGEEKEIRQNFLKAGNSFCRLCLRSHLVRIYRTAIEHQVPYVFLGLSPDQCLDCQDAIKWSLQAIKDLETPFGQHNKTDILRRYKHRAFQGGFETGFKDHKENFLYQEWQHVFDSTNGFVPILVPFFIFEEYPGSDVIMETLSSVMDWKRPEVLLNRTNCIHLRLAGIMNRAITGHHLNYKEHATNLRRAGVVLSESEMLETAKRIDQSENTSEEMQKDDFEERLHQKFGIGTNELPLHVQNSLHQILM